MLNELDETIRQLFSQSGDYDLAQVDVSFKIPNRDWSTSVSNRPTLNCYLFDIRENRELRQHGIDNINQGGRVSGRQRPVSFFDLTYLITAWTSEVEDEHRLLWKALHALLRYERLPDALLAGTLQESTIPVYARTALQEGVLKSPGEFWTALDNQIKPSLSYVLTVGIDREAFLVEPPVLTAGVRIQQIGAGEPRGQRESDPRWIWLGGTVRGTEGRPVSGAVVRIMKGDSQHVQGANADYGALQANTDREGRYRIRVPGPGSYTLVTSIGAKIQRRTILIPEERYDVSFGAEEGGAVHP
jgi:Pvc16 N-terminal domain/Carboxypeptidase regulatory-like domain